MEADPRSLVILTVDHHHLRHLDILANLVTIELLHLPATVNTEDHLCRASLPLLTVAHRDPHKVSNLAAVLVTDLLPATRRAKIPTPDHLHHRLPTVDLPPHLTADNSLPLNHLTVDNHNHLTVDSKHRHTVDPHHPLTDHLNLPTRDLRMANRFLLATASHP